MSSSPSHRSVDGLDVVAASLARGLPGLSPRIDQLRHDVRGVLAPWRGQRVAPVHTPDSGPLPPPPLLSIDPLYHLLPKAARERYARLRRDTRMVLDGLRGQHPPPLVQLPPRPPKKTSHGVQDGARTLAVVEVQHETDDAVSLLLRDVGGRPIHFVPGQFLTVLVDVQGEPLRRAYSIASAASDTQQVRIAIKRVKDGRVSNFLNERMRQGQQLRVLGPSGNFTCAPQAEAARHVVLLGGGSGITPLMSIARSVLESEPGSRVSLIYGNRGTRDIIFASALEELAARYPERFVLRHVLSEPPQGWQGGVGMLDATTAEAELGTLRADERPAEYFVCGPEPMMAGCRQALLARGVDPERIHEESFVAPGLRDTARVRRVSEPQDITVDVAGKRTTVRAGADQTLLEAGLEAGLPMKFSCAMGGCGACKVKLHDGQVESEQPNCLTAREHDAGYVLACVTRAGSACHIEVE